MEQRFKKIKDKFLKDKGSYDNLSAQKQSKEEEIQILKHQQEVFDKARLLLLKTANYQREKIRKDLQDMVTKALQYIREEDICFVIKPKESRGIIEFEFLIKTIRDGITTITDVMESRGDGVSDITSLSLDIAMLELSDKEGPIVLDEPARQLSKSYVENLGNLLKELSIAFGRQIIMITHNKELSTIGNKKILVELIGTETRLSTED